MKILKSPQKVLILFLSVFVILSAIFIVRLEIKAASLQSRLDEHHKSLGKNEDVLSDLKIFMRMVEHNGIYLDKKMTGLFTPFSNLQITDDLIRLKSSGDIWAGLNSNKCLGYDKSGDFIYMYHNGSRILLGEQKLTSGKKSKGMRLVSSSGGKPAQVYIVENGIILTVPGKKGDYKISMAPQKDYIKITKDESIIKLEKENIDIRAKGDIRLGPTKDKYLGYNSKEDEIQIRQSGSTISFGECYDGKTLVGTGVKIQGKNNGPRLFVTEKNIRLQIPSQKGSYDITLDPSTGFLGLKCGDSYVILEKDNIDIEAKGDISINSLNGNVNINGKKVNLNE